MDARATGPPLEDKQSSLPGAWRHYFFSNKIVFNLKPTVFRFLESCAHCISTRLHHCS